MSKQTSGWSTAATITAGSSSEATAYDALIVGLPEATLTLQPAESGATDTMFHSGLSSTSFATNAQLQVGNQGGTRTRTAMVWDLSSIPDESEITEATLTLTEHTDGMDDEQTVRVQRVTQAMTEAATWATYDGSNSWTSAGGDFSTDIQSDTATSGGTLTINNSKFVELCQDALDNRSKSLKILLATVYELGGGNSGNQRMKYNSATDSTASDRPKLVIKYMPGVTTMNYYHDSGLSTRGGRSATLLTNVVYPFKHYGIDSFGLPSGLISIGLRDD